MNKKIIVFISCMITLLILVIIYALYTQNKMINKYNYVSLSSDAKVKEVKYLIDDESFDIAPSTYGNNSVSISTNTNANTTNSSPSGYATNSSDEGVLNYLNELNDGISTKNTNNSSVKDKAKKAFTTVVDFLFYDGTIKGKTFKELTDKGKMEAIKIGIKIEDKVNEYYPGLIDGLGDKYKESKTKITSLYEEKTNEFCTKYPENCGYFKSDYNDMKKSFSMTFDLIKDAGSSITSKASSWYQKHFKS